ncbi:MAG: protein kinase [Oscillospiraceae bacterium]|nr:protein kinase [Oscillospiraceae bacterium]
MNTPISPSTYREVSPLDESGCVVLVQKEDSGELFVKKTVSIRNESVYKSLMDVGIEGIPKICEICSTNNCLTVFEEYISGAALSEVLSTRIFYEHEVIDITLKLCRILSALHRRGIVHRDIKPSNIIIDTGGKVTLIDLDASKIYTEGSSQDTVLLGTSGFAAPEQYGFSSSSPQTDIYALGVLMNVMLCRKLPGEYTHRGKLRHIINRCLKLNPKDRYTDVHELYHALKRAKIVKAEWLPPGFRTMRFYKILIAVPYYIFVILVAACIDKGPNESTAQWNVIRLMFFMLGIFPVLFYFNYMDIRRYFPFMRSKSKKLRVLGYILSTFIIVIIVLSIAVALLLLLMI